MAIAFGAISAVANSSSVSSVSVSGSDTIGIVNVTGGVGSDTVTNVNWGGVAMTRIDGILNPSDRYTEVYYIISPPSGTSTINFTGGSYYRGASSYYTGVHQTTPIDSSATNSSASTTSLSITPTVTASGCWIIAAGKSGGGTQTAAGVLGTMHISADAGAVWFGDSNGTVGTGSQTATINNSSTLQMAGIAFAIAPVAGAAPTFTPRVMMIS